MNPQAVPTASTELDALAATILARHGTRQDQLLPLLHALQDAIGYIPPNLVPAIAAHVNLSRAEVHGVLTFYHDFRSAPPAPCVVQLCRAESCQSMGAERLLAHVQAVLGCGLHERSFDGSVALEPVYCLGQCASSPAVTIDGVVHARVTPQRFDALLARAVDASRTVAEAI